MDAKALNLNCPKQILIFIGLFIICGGFGDCERLFSGEKVPSSGGEPSFLLWMAYEGKK